MLVSPVLPARPELYLDSGSWPRLDPVWGMSCQSRLLMSTKLTVITPKSLSISLFMAPISLSISLREEEEVEEEERAEG